MVIGGAGRCADERRFGDVIGEKCSTDRVEIRRCDGGVRCGLDEVDVRGAGACELDAE